jgi:hypothetical protein
MTNICRCASHLPVAKKVYMNSYVAAYMEETEIWGNVTVRNQVVFHDNDFEIFVDPTGTTHMYKEFEVNALNTTWNLLLNRPYRDNGHENSARVDPIHGFDMYRMGLSSAVFLKGVPNDPSTCVRLLPSPKSLSQ